MKKITIIFVLFSIIFLQGNRDYADDYNFRSFQSNVCLNKTMGCGEVGTLHFTGTVGNCQYQIGDPFVWLEMDFGGACLWKSISSDDSFVIDSGSWGAKVQFLYNVSYTIGFEQTFQQIRDLTCSYQHMLTCYN